MDLLAGMGKAMAPGLAGAAVGIGHGMANQAIGGFQNDLKNSLNSKLLINFDKPAGGEIDTLRYRQCYGQVCMHDPNGTNNLNTEWLRRAAPEEPYKSPAIRIPPRPHLHHMAEKPQREVELVPYWQVSDPTPLKVFNSQNLKISSINSYFPINSNFSNFL
jgi:hypothetical protein